MGNVLILKKRGQRYRFEIGPRRKNTYVPANCNMEVNMENYKDFALFLSDLKTIWGVPVDKAISEYLKSKNESEESPFW